MRKNGNGGSIVTLLSTVTQRPNPKSPAYTASKFGLLGLTRALAMRYQSEKIRINALSPGVSEHQIGSSEDISPEQVQLSENFRKETGFPLRLITLNEIVNAILWLCSDQASGISGANIVVDDAGL